MGRIVHSLWFLNGNVCSIRYIHCPFFLKQDYVQRNAFILTQAPLDNTIEDFWRMVSQYDIGTVVMLNSFKEGKEVAKTYSNHKDKPTLLNYVYNIFHWAPSASSPVSFRPSLYILTSDYARRSVEGSFWRTLINS